MNKEELTTAVAKHNKMSKTQTMAMIDSCFTEISKALKKGQDVRLVGFGSWKRMKRKARTGRNPQTGEKLKIKARNVAKFNMSQDLFEKLN